MWYGAHQSFFAGKISRSEIKALYLYQWLLEVLPVIGIDFMYCYPKHIALSNQI
jgi:hypothetical protein